MGKSSVNGPFSIAMLIYQRVNIHVNPGLINHGTMVYNFFWGYFPKSNNLTPKWHPHPGFSYPYIYLFQKSQYFQKNNVFMVLTMVSPPFLDVLTIASKANFNTGRLQSHVHGHEGRVCLGRSAVTQSWPSDPAWETLTKMEVSMGKP